MKHNYYEVEALNFSGLSRIAKHPSTFKKKSKPGRHFDKGSAVDILLTEGLKKFEEQVYIHSDNFPTGKVLTLADTIFKDYQESGDKVDIKVFATPQHCLDTMDVIDFHTNMVANPEGRTKKFDLPEFWSYLQMLQMKDKKIVLDYDEYRACKAIVTSLQTHKNTKKYTQLTSRKYEDIYDQLEVYWTFLGENMKCKLDRVIVNNNNKTIQPIDFKTTGDSTLSFVKSITRFNYNYQASIYLEGVKHQFKDLLSDGYTILPFMFIIETTVLEYVGTPRLFTINEKTIELSAKGGKIKGYYVKGWKELVVDKIWYDANGYEEHRDYVENKGIIEIDLYD
jgi:hypothetical protein